jgi:hypothetical protein
MSAALSHKLMYAVATAFACVLVLAPAASAQTSSTSGGATFVPPPPPPEKGALVDGRLVAPASAPRRVKQVITAANRIVEKPYVYGGGHTLYRRGVLDRGYDCSGAVSYALHGAGLLAAPRDSTGLMSWGRSGAGRWISVYANGGHTFVVIAGLRFDTSGRGENGPRWRPEPRSGRGYVVRHAAGL